jgi:hypothetical protein
VAHLIEPVFRQREILAPDPAYALRQLARWAAPLPEGVLKAAAHRVLEQRHSKVTTEHVVAAVREVQKTAGMAPKLDRPAAPRVAADGKIDISEREHPEAFAAWLAHHRDRRSRKLTNTAGLGEAHGFFRELTLYPPALPTRAPPVRADTTGH